MYKLFIFLFSFMVLSCSKVEDTSINSTLETIADEASFDAKIKTGVSLIFFHATWCPKCASQRPAVESIVSNSKLKDVFFAQVDFEKNEKIVNKSNVIGFPTILLLKNGIEKHRFETAGITSATLEQKLLELLK